ncbi:Flagellar motor switch protein FliM [Dermatophilus congolensis]|uniref:Flagellar motor switch protein FliM n=1 Tax=Dermatophilus congolensis TaxID=1863 RepID=A0A239VVJ5_9MICO|nr:FliM/FliN family flagellar motor switch protein [Dermatophilus congolensis]SNV25713.1 Flagellar motor switch protein FliM [Dermatophilus congolensis]
MFRLRSPHQLSIRSHVSAEPIVYDFRSPNRFSREQFRALQVANETFSRQIATVLSTTLRMVVHCNLEEVEQTTYDEYISTLPNPSLLAIVTLDPLPDAGLFHMPLEVGMNVIDRLLGGPGTTNQPTRALSEMEAGLIGNVLRRMVNELAYAFETLEKIHPVVGALESDAQFIQLVQPSDPMVVSTFELRLGEQEAKASLALPISTVQPALDKLTEKPPLELTGPRAVAVEQLRQQVSTVPQVVRVAFDEITLTSGDILDLEVGDVLPLGHPTNQPLTMSADGVPVAKAVPGSHGHRFACQIVSL